MSKQLTLSQIDELCLQFGYETRAVRAVINVETPGYGFSKTTGRILIQFEPHIFKRYSKISIPNGVEGQGPEWLAYEKAAKLYPRYAKLSTSWGLGQIMGFNFAAAGFASVEDMVKSFQESELNQLRGMLNFIKDNRRLSKALLTHDWRTFAYYYNGEKYYLNQYDARLAAAYQKLGGQPLPVAPLEPRFPGSVDLSDFYLPLQLPFPNSGKEITGIV